jgi:hypothetical protein
MAKYKHTDSEDGQGLFLTVNLKEQRLPGTFEYMLDDLIGGKIDISVFDRNYKNDKTGAPAIPPAALIKLILYGYSKGRNSSRGIAELSRNNITAKALTGNVEPHWTSIADFISGNHEAFEVLAYSDELGLIGSETFAIDGLRLPSNAPLALTGTKEERGKRLEVYKKMAEKHTERRQRRDEQGEADGETKERYEERQKKLKRRIEKLSGFIESMEEKEGKRGQEIRSNMTDNESALILIPEGLSRDTSG